jgi:hypothetical protein
MSKLTDLLKKKPDIDKFWAKYGAALISMGFRKEDVVDVEALTDLMLIAKAMNGDVACKKYIDERAAAERRADKRMWESEHRGKI